LKTPLTAVLDEAANVVRWRELPDVYSHYGSRGIVVSTFFQSYSQGVEAYGEKGMNKLWGAANIRVAGSGLSDDKFLPFLVQ
ncbi:TraG/TraD/VirD4 family protein, partial [Escherichia coli]|nr:TraG/TraD/VirD4 family protein [Escherichia coli]